MSHATLHDPSSRAANRAATVLAILLALLPAAGMPSELVLQDTLKSAILVAGTLAATGVWLAARPTTWRWHGILALPLLWMAYALGSMAWSHSYLAGVEAARWASLSLLLWIGLQSLHPGNAMRWVWGIHAGAVVASVWTAAQFWLDLSWFNQAAPPASTFANRNFFAEFAVCAVPFSALALAQLRHPRWRQIMALSLGFNLVALLMTGTRSALGALVLVVPMVVWVLWRYRQQLAWTHWSRASKLSVTLILFASVLSLGHVPSNHPDMLGQTALNRSGQRAVTMATGATYKEGSFAYRSVMWRGSASMLLAKPWTGVGAGAWEVFIPVYLGPAADEEPDYYAHNEYVQLLCEYGLPLAGATLAILLAYLLLAARNTLRLDPATEIEAPLRATALCSLLALMIVSLAGFPWRLATTGALLVMNLALLAGSDTRLRLKDALGHGVRPLGRKFVVIGYASLVLGATLATVVCVQAMRAEVKIVGGIQILNRALSIRHSDPQASEADRLQGVRLLREGISINPHYRKIVAIGAEQLGRMGDWENATFILESIAQSRPYLANVWANLELSYLALQDPAKAELAWRALAQLQPDAKRTRALEVLLLRRSGKTDEAAQKVRSYLDAGIVEYDLVRFAVEIGLDTGDTALAKQGYALWVKGWPSEGAEQAEVFKRFPTP